VGKNLASIAQAELFKETLRSTSKDENNYHEPTKGEDRSQKIEVRY